LDTLQKTARDKLWIRQAGTGEKSICFATAFRLDRKRDLTSFAKALPEGVVLCDTGIIAGLEHLEAILLQTREYWQRNERLVRNGSIEILMRLSAEKQISDAVEASKIQATDSVTLLGLADKVEEISKFIELFQTTFQNYSQDLRLLDLDREKARHLKGAHGLLASSPDKKLLIALQELSVLLIFSK
jgi:tRNA threonylcarbamoyladenosine modification (KEOPS) complex Cgi121 subunit